MLDIHYQDPRLVELYDLDSGWCIDRDFYLSLPGPHSRKILDLGCGTGLLCNAYAKQGHKVTGVDPSRATLEVARRKPQGTNIEWVQCSAELFNSEKRYDLVIMTGHVFQVLLEVERVLGGWQGQEFDETSSEEMIFVLRPSSKY